MHGRGGCVAGGWGCITGVCVGGDQEWQGVCMAGGGMCGRGHAWQGGMYVGEMVTEAVGTHPSGMHSC